MIGRPSPTGLAVVFAGFVLLEETELVAKLAVYRGAAR